MPQTLRTWLSFEMLLALAMSIILPMLDISGPGWSTAALALFPLVLCGAFWMRVPLADVALKTYCAAILLFSAAYTLGAFGGGLTVSPGVDGIFIALEALAVGGLLVAINTNAAREWFGGPRG